MTIATEFWFCFLIYLLNYKSIIQKSLLFVFLEIHINKLIFINDLSTFQIQHIVHNTPKADSKHSYIQANFAIALTQPKGSFEKIMS